MTSGVLENIGEYLDIELLAGCAIGGGRGRRELDSLEGGIGLQLANHFLAAAIRIEHLAEEGLECSPWSSPWRRAVCDS